MCRVEGRKGLVIIFPQNNPEQYLVDKSFVGLSGEELKLALSKPFVTSIDLEVRILYKDKEYNFIIPQSYDWNGANVPSFAWKIIGQQFDPRFKLASCIHDYLCEHKEVIEYNRYLSTLVFEALCEYFGRFNSLKRWAMFHTVDNAQKFRRWRP